MRTVITFPFSSCEGGSIVVLLSVTNHRELQFRILGHRFQQLGELSQTQRQCGRL